MQETPDKTGLLLELPKFRKSSKASQDDQESNESFSSGFRSGPESEGKKKSYLFPLASLVMLIY